MLIYPWLEQLVWWMLGFSAVLVHRAVVTTYVVRGNVEEEGGDDATNVEYLK